MASFPVLSRLIHKCLPNAVAVRMGKQKKSLCSPSDLRGGYQESLKFFLIVALVTVVVVIVIVVVALEPALRGTVDDDDQDNNQDDCNCEVHG